MAVLMAKYLVDLYSGYLFVHNQTVYHLTFDCCYERSCKQVNK